MCLCFALIAAGCDGGNQNTQKPIWADTKLSDLSPAQGSRPADAKKISTVNVQIYIYQIPAEKTDKLDEISGLLTLQTFRFNHHKAFTANGFVTGLGRTSSGDKIFGLLNVAGGRKAGSVSLLLQDGQTDYVPVTELFAAKSIFYTTAEDESESKSIGPGRLALRITAQKNRIFRGTYSITAVPAVLSPLMMPGMQIQDTTKLDDIVFDSCSFMLSMSPGDFIFLRPDKYIDSQNSLDSLFFSRPGIRPVVLAFLIVCVDVIE
jgi:hypothetical protein